MDRETFRRLLLARILARMTELEDLLGPRAKNLDEYKHLDKLRSELKDEVQ